MNKLEIGKEEIHHLAKSLRKVGFFADLSMADLDKFLNVTQLYSYKSGKTVFKEGDVGNALYVVHRGSVKIKKSRGFFLPSKTIQTLKEGAIFGEMALLDQPFRTATVVTEGSTQLFVLLSADFNNLLRDNPYFRKGMQRMAEVRKFESH